MVSEMRRINNNKCLSELKCLQNIFHTNMMNDVSTIYSDGGRGYVLHMQKIGGVCPGGVVRGGFVLLNYRRQNNGGVLRNLTENTMCWVYYYYYHYYYYYYFYFYFYFYVK